MAIKAAIGSAMMKAGSAVAGPAMTKSLSGRGLRSGSMLDKKTSDNVNKLTNSAKESLKVMRGISKGLVKFTQFMAKSSPALKQQLIVLNKSITLLLKPIGDIMAKFMRPMATWVMKVSMKWYSLFATKSKGQEEPEAALKLERGKLASLKNDPNANPEDIAEIQDNIKTLESSSQSTEVSSDISPFLTYTKGLEIINTALNDSADTLTKYKSKADELASDTSYNKILDGISKDVSDMWHKILPDSIKGLFDAISFAATNLWEALKSIKDVLSPLLKPIGGLIAYLTGAILLTAIDAITLSFEGMGIVFKAVANIFKTVKIAWDAFLIKLDSLANWIGIKIPSAIETLTNWFSKLVEKIKSVFNAIKNKLNIFNFLGHKAVGGEIEQTGLYQLHAGERVITAGNNSRTNNKSMNIINHINIQATVNNDVDIRDLARQLAELSESEMRRRVSYM